MRRAFIYGWVVVAVTSIVVLVTRAYPDVEATAPASAPA